MSGAIATLLGLGVGFGAVSLAWIAGDVWHRYASRRVPPMPEPYEPEEV